VASSTPEATEATSRTGSHLIRPHDEGKAIMKLFALRVGRTKVPFGQFYGGLQNWSISDFAQDKDHFIWVPIYSYLIEHPQAGPILADLGISPAQAEHAGYYQGSIMEYVRTRTSTICPPARLLGHIFSAMATSRQTCTPSSSPTCTKTM
jgi:hypothetical protein